MANILKVNSPITCYDIYWDRTQVFEHVYACSKHYGDTPDNVLAHIQPTANGLYLGRYLLCDLECPRIHVDTVTRIEWVKNSYRHHRPLTVTDIMRGRTFIATSCQEMARVLNIPEAVIFNNRYRQYFCYQAVQYEIGYIGDLEHNRV